MVLAAVLPTKQNPRHFRTGGLLLETEFCSRLAGLEAHAAHAAHVRHAAAGRHS
jgi:hypothetical protein